MELMKLSQVSKLAPNPDTKDREKECPGYYSHWCPFMISKYHVGLRDSVVLAHSPQGCVGNERTFLSTYVSQYFGQPFIHSPTTNLTPGDTILGAEEKLREAIREVDKIYKPKMIFILVSCCAGVIKEPVEEVAEELRKEISSDILVIRAEGFTHHSANRIRNYISERLATLMKEPKKKIHNSVNLLGMSKEIHYRGNYTGDSIELERILNSMGLRVNSVLFQGASLEELERAPEAQFNCLICPEWGYPMAKVMLEKYGVPHGKKYYPLGITLTKEWIMEVGEFFGIRQKASEVIEAEYEKIRDIWERAKKLVQGKIALVDGGDPQSSVGKAILWSRMCEDLGMRPIIFNVPPIEIKGSIYQVSFSLDNGYDPEVVYSDYSYHRRFSPFQVAKELGLSLDDVGVYVGDVYPRTMSDWDKPFFDPANVPRVITTTHCSRHRGFPGRRSGFRGAEAFARDVINNFKMARRKEKPTLSGRLGGI